MTDVRSRLRERDARRGLDPAAETGLLAERLRSGALTRERLGLAAYCGHHASGVVLGIVARRCADCGSEEEAYASTCMPCLGPDGHPSCRTYHENVEDCPNAECKSTDACGYCGSCDHIDGAEWVQSLPRTPDALEDWLRGLLEHDAAGSASGWVLARAGRAVLGVAMEAHLSRRRRNSLRAAVARSAEAIDAWLACPCDEHRDACDEAPPPENREHPVLAFEVLTCALRARDLVTMAGRIRARATDDLVATARSLVAADVLAATGGVRGIAGSSAVDLLDAVQARSASSERAKAAVKSALTEWALR